MIGYEFEFFVLHKDTLKPITSEEFDDLHHTLAEEGWENKFDPLNKKLAYSKKGELALKTDDPLHGFELNMPPRETIQEAQDDIQAVFANISKKIAKHNLAIVGFGTYPGSLVHMEPTRLNYILSRAPLMKELGDIWDKTVGNHIWLDVPQKDLIKTTNMFIKLSGILITLFASSSYLDEKKQPNMAQRIVELEKLRKYNFIMDIPDKLYTSFYDYINMIFSSRFYIIVNKEGICFYEKDPTTTCLEYLKKDAVEVIRADLELITVNPSIDDVEEMSRRVLPEIRPKWRFKKEANLKDFLEAYANKDNEALLEFLEASFLEIRTVPCQKPSEISAAPAFCLGLQENMEKVEAFLNKHNYTFWKNLREEAIKDGLAAHFNGKPITEFITPLVDLAKKGLEQRGHGEEKFLKPLFERVQKKQNPAQEMLALIEERGIHAAVDAFSYKP